MHINRIRLHQPQAIGFSISEASSPSKKTLNKKIKSHSIRGQRSNVSSFSQMWNDLNIQNKGLLEIESPSPMHLSQPIYKTNPSLRKSNLLQIPSGKHLAPRGNQNRKIPLESRYDQLFQKGQNELPFNSQEFKWISSHQRSKSDRKQQTAEHQRTEKRTKINPYTNKQYLHFQNSNFNSWKKSVDQRKASRLRNILIPCQVTAIMINERFPQQKTRPNSSCEFSRPKSKGSKAASFRTPSQKGILSQFQPWELSPNDDLEIGEL